MGPSTASIVAPPPVKRNKSSRQVHRRLARVEAVGTGRDTEAAVAAGSRSSSTVVLLVAESVSLPLRSCGGALSVTVPPLDLQAGEQIRGRVRREQRGIDPHAVGYQVIDGQRIDNRRQIDVQRFFCERYVGKRFAGSDRPCT